MLLAVNDIIGPIQWTFVSLSNDLETETKVMIILLNISHCNNAVRELTVFEAYTLRFYKKIVRIKCCNLIT